MTPVPGKFADAFQNPKPYTRANRACQHGGSDDPSIKVVRDNAIYDCIREMQDGCREIKRRHANDDTPLEDLKSEMAYSDMNTVLNFWLRPQHNWLLDLDLIKICFGHAADAAIDQNLLVSRQFAMLGIQLEAWVELGQDEFLRSFSSAAAMQPVVRCLRETSTDRGLVLFIAKKIPCSCLQERVQIAKAQPRLEKCGHCHKEFLKVKIMKCARCRETGYCSKACQRAHWKESHKKLCVPYVQDESK